MKLTEFNNREIMRQILINDFLVDDNYKVYLVFCKGLCSSNGMILECDQVIKQITSIYSKGEKKFERNIISQNFMLLKEEHEIL